MSDAPLHTTHNLGSARCRALPIFLTWVLGLTACHTLDHREPLESEILRGTEFNHRIFYRRPGDATTLSVFIDGDGSPWLDHGTRIAADPTPRHPLALDLASRTPGAVLYLARPCAFGTLHEVSCNADVWTSGRYSEQVIESMAAAINRYTAHHGIRNVLLIGYSGGGTLGVLIAPHVPTTRAVLTISANLDSAAWTAWHQYLPLEKSLDAAQQPALPRSISEWHIVGAKDRNVPVEINREYWARVPSSHIWIYLNADHACCWVRLWPQIWARLQTELAEASATAVTQSPR